MNTDSSCSILEFKDIQEKQEQVRTAFSNLLGRNGGVALLPPVPDQKSLTSNGYSRAILPSVNEALLSRDLLVKEDGKRLFLPLIRDNKVLAVLVLEPREKLIPLPDYFKKTLLTTADLLLDNLFLRKSEKLDTKTGLTRFEYFGKKLQSLLPETLSAKKSNQFHDTFEHKDRVPGIILLAFRTVPKKEYPLNFWDNSWKDLVMTGQFLAENLPDNCTGTILSQGILVVLWPDGNGAKARAWAEHFMNLLKEHFPRLSSGGNTGNPHGALVRFPYDFYDYFKSGLPGLDRNDGNDFSGYIFGRLWQLLDITITTQNKAVWSWENLRHLGIVPDASSPFFSKINDFLVPDKTFAVLAIKYTGDLVLGDGEPFYCFMTKTARDNLEPGAFVDWYDGETMVVLIQGKDREYIEHFSQHLLHVVGKNKGVGLNIGAAFHPFIDFRPEDAFLNALKALVHAELLGQHAFVTADAVTFNVSGDNFFNQGKFILAMEEYKKGLMIDPQNVNILNSLAVCHGELGNLKEAEDTFLKVLKLEPENFMACFNLGCLLIRSGEIAKAQETLENAVHLNPDSAETHFYLGKILKEKEKTRDVIDHLHKAVSLKPDWELARRLLAECYMDCGNKKKAAENYRKIVCLNPKDAPSLDALGCIYGEDQRDLEIGISLCRQAVELEPQNRDFRMHLAENLIKAGDLEGAGKILKPLLEKGEKNEKIIKLKEAIDKSLCSLCPL